MGRRTAILIGNQVFPEESELLGPRNDVDALGRVLEDPAFGCFDNIKKFLDRPHNEIYRAIVEELKQAAKCDLVLIFYSGHGKQATSGKLYLATADTTQLALQATAISTTNVNEAVQESPCDQVVLLLDCCYSGAVSAGLKGGRIEDQLRAVQNTKGFFILTASTAIQTARESEEDYGGKVMGRFTAAIVSGIESGTADIHGTGTIGLWDLKTHVECTVRGQTPQFFTHEGVGDPLISLNPRVPVSPDPITVEDLDAEQWDRRLGAVSLLTGILKGENQDAKKTALSALRRRLLDEQDDDIKFAIERALVLGDETAPADDHNRDRQRRNAIARRQGSKLARAYDDIFRGYNDTIIRNYALKRYLPNNLPTTAFDKRIPSMEAIVTEMMAVSLDYYTITEFAESKSPGKRLLAIVSCERDSTNFHMFDWLAERCASESPLASYHALLALNSAASHTTAFLYATFLEEAMAIVEAKASSSMALRVDSRCKDQLERFRLTVADLRLQRLARFGDQSPMDVVKNSNLAKKLFG